MEDIDYFHVQLKLKKIALLLLQLKNCKMANRTKNHKRIIDITAIR